MFIRIKNAIFREEEIRTIGVGTDGRPTVMVEMRDGSIVNIHCKTESEAFEIIETTWKKVNPKNKKKGWLF